MASGLVFFLLLGPMFSPVWYSYTPGHSGQKPQLCLSKQFVIPEYDFILVLTIAKLSVNKYGSVPFSVT